MALTKPILANVGAFDATQAYTFTFSVLGGDKVEGNTLTITNQSTGVVVYNKAVTSTSYTHTLPANTLVNGQSYTAYVNTTNEAGELSPKSNTIQFNCYAAATLTFSNMPSGGIIDASEFNFNVTYNQAQGDGVSDYIFNLYDVQGVLISTSGIQHPSSVSSPPIILSHKFSGFSDNTSYFVECNVNSVSGLQSSTGRVSITVSYEQPVVEGGIGVSANCQDGYMQGYIDWSQIPENIDQIKIKRRKVDSFDWATMSVGDISTRPSTVSVSWKNQTIPEITGFQAMSANGDALVKTGGEPALRLATTSDDGVNWKIGNAISPIGTSDGITSNTMLSNLAWGEKFMPTTSSRDGYITIGKLGYADANPITKPTGNAMNMRHYCFATKDNYGYSYPAIVICDTGVEYFDDNKWYSRNILSKFSELISAKCFFCNAFQDGVERIICIGKTTDGWECWANSNDASGKWEKFNSLVLSNDIVDFVGIDQQLYCLKQSGEIDKLVQGSWEVIGNLPTESSADVYRVLIPIIKSGQSSTSNAVKYVLLGVSNRKQCYLDIEKSSVGNLINDATDDFFDYIANQTAQYVIGRDKDGLQITYLLLYMSDNLQCSVGCLVYYGDENFATLAADYFVDGKYNPNISFVYDSLVYEKEVCLLSFSNYQDNVNSRIIGVMLDYVSSSIHMEELEQFDRAIVDGYSTPPVRNVQFPLFSINGYIYLFSYSTKSVLITPSPYGSLDSAIIVSGDLNLHKFGQYSVNDMAWYNSTSASPLIVMCLDGRLLFRNESNLLADSSLSDYELTNVGVSKNNVIAGVAASSDNSSATHIFFWQSDDDVTRIDTLGEVSVNTSEPSKGKIFILTPNSGNIYFIICGVLYKANDSFNGVTKIAELTSENINVAWCSDYSAKTDESIIVVESLPSGSAYQYQTLVFSGNNFATKQIFSMPIPTQAENNIYTNVTQFRTRTMLTGPTAPTLYFTNSGIQSFVDYTASDDQEYEYALVPVFDGNEGNYLIVTAKSQFDGVFITDGTDIYKFYADVAYGNFQQTQKVNAHEPFGRKYPVIVSNAATNYMAGSMSGMVLAGDYLKTGKIDRKAIAAERDTLLKFLTNKKPKILKDWNGNIWMVAIVDNPSVTYYDGSGMGLMNVSMTFMEVGDATNVNDLAANGFAAPEGS
jgi:hypothetical protein